MQSMATSRSTKPRASTRTPKSDGRRSKATTKAEAPRQSLADIGREAAQAAQKAALLEACTRLSWNLSAVARELSLSNASNVIRSLKTLGLEAEYKAARRAEYED